MSIQEQRRARFEAYIRASYPQDIELDGEAIFTQKEGTYDWHWVRVQWENWNAALDSVVIELPDTVANTGTLTSTAVLGYKRECREAIEAAGLKVKP